MREITAFAMIMHIKAAKVIGMQPLKPKDDRRLGDGDRLGIVKFGMHGHSEPQVICFPQECGIALKIPAQVSEVFWSCPVLVPVSFEQCLL
jgi:hypothetical protein